MLIVMCTVIGYVNCNVTVLYVNCNVYSNWLCLLYCVW